jgi:replicative DNA helicase
LGKGKLRLVVVDYLQLMTLGYRTESRFVEVSAMSRELKGLAHTLQCPILALSQLNRESESQFSDGKPKLSHLRESGSIEQDADIVMLLSWPKNDKASVIVDVAKNRHGPLGEVRLNWTPQYTRFHDPGD